MGIKDIDILVFLTSAQIAINVIEVHTGIGSKKGEAGALIDVVLKYN